MHKNSAIVILLTSEGWQATFYHVDHMPDDIAFPLPFTSAALEHTVRADLHSRFPGASIVTSTYRQMGFGASGWTI